MKLESLVMAYQQRCREYVPESCTHRPSHHGRWFRPKPPTQPQGERCRRWGWWLGWSRNKVAVPEGAAGSPPFKEKVDRFTYLTYGWERYILLITAKVLSKTFFVFWKEIKSSIITYNLAFCNASCKNLKLYHKCCMIRENVLHFQILYKFIG